MTHTARPRTHLLLAGLLLLYWAASLSYLDVAPPVYEDEPWQASTGWKLATQGVFGSDVFAGYHAMERRYHLRLHADLRTTPMTRLPVQAKPRTSKPGSLPRRSMAAGGPASVNPSVSTGAT